MNSNTYVRLPEQDPHRLTREQIREAARDTTEFAKQLALLVGEPVGEA